jgi:O-antigen/teichoic acid export membrane protein
MSGAVSRRWAIGRTPALRRVVEHVRTPLHRDGYALAFNSAFTAAVGLVYWIVAAHAFSAHAVGLNAALISAMMFVAGVSTLNLPNIFVRFLPGAGRGMRRFVLLSYATATSVAASAATLLVLIAGRLAPGAELAGSTTGLQIWFVVATVAWCLFVLQDGVLTALGRAVWVPAENAGFSLAKLAMLPAFAAAMPLYGVFVSWTVAMVAMVVVVNGVLFGRLLRAGRRGPRGAAAAARPRGFARYFAADWVCSLSWLASTTLLPVIVTAAAGATTNAYFSLAWAVAFPLYAIGHNIGMSLVLHGSSDRPALPQLVRRAALQGGGLLLGLTVVLVVLAPYALMLFGGNYADGGTTLLRLLALGALPNLVLALAVSIARVERRLRMAMIALGTQALLSLGSAAPLADTLGVSGPGVAWLGSQCIVAAGLLGLLLNRTGRRQAASAILADVASGGWLRGVRGARRARRVLGDMRAPVRRIRTDSDLVVFRVGPRGSPRLVVKIAWTPVGSERLAAQVGALRSVQATPGLGAWTSLLPDVVEAGAVERRSYAVERALPGVDARRFARDGRREVALAAAARCMQPLYEAASTEVVVDRSCLADWVSLRVDRVARECGEAKRETFESLRCELDAGLLGQPVRAGSVHGDLWLGNLLMEPDASAVTGVLDWEHASPHGPVAADLGHLVLSTRALASGDDLGVVTARLIDGRDELSELELELLTGWGVRPREVLLLAWLQHLTGRLTQSTLHPLGRWLRHNVDPVLEVLGR